MNDRHQAHFAQFIQDLFDAIFVVGGHAPMITFRSDTALQRLVARFYESEKLVGLVSR